MRMMMLAAAVAVFAAGAGSAQHACAQTDGQGSSMSTSGNAVQTTVPPGSGTATKPGQDNGHDAPAATASPPDMGSGGGLGPNTGGPSATTGAKATTSSSGQ